MCAPTFAVMIGLVSMLQLAFVLSRMTTMKRRMHGNVESRMT